MAAQASFDVKRGAAGFIVVVVILTIAALAGNKVAGR